MMLPKNVTVGGYFVFIFAIKNIDMTVAEAKS